MPDTDPGDVVAHRWSFFASTSRDIDAAFAGLVRERLHDLRRTDRSLMSRAGVDPDIAERCLGHAIGGMRRVYDRHNYIPEMRDAFEALAEQIDRIINPPGNNVVALTGTV